MSDDSEICAHLVSNLIDDETEYNDTEGEWPEADPQDLSNLGLGEVEFGDQLSHDHRPQAKEK